MTEAAARPHIPVMGVEMLHYLAPRDGGIYVDGTFGAGGYSEAILNCADCQVWAIDRDPDAVAQGQTLMRRYPGRLTVLQGRFGDMIALLQKQGVPSADGVAFDFGVSSMQLDQSARGFSFRYQGALDMRMEQAGRSAADIVNHEDEEEIAHILFVYGEERQSRRIARAIVKARALAPIETTQDLARIVHRALGTDKIGKIDSATRTFQALRIAVNDELGEIDRGLSAAEQILRAGGRLVAVTFHSLEDRRVKNFMRRRSEDKSSGNRYLPALENVPAPTLRLLTRKAVTPGAPEIADNPRSRSAKLRAAERTSAPLQPERAWGEAA